MRNHIGGGGGNRRGRGLDADRFEPITATLQMQRVQSRLIRLGLLLFLCFVCFCFLVHVRISIGTRHRELERQPLRRIADNANAAERAEHSVQRAQTQQLVVRRHR